MPVKKWQSETEITAELRDLTEKLRKVRQDLEDIVHHPPGASRERRFLHMEPAPKGHASARSGERRRTKAR